MIEALYVMTVERTRQQRLGDAIRAARKDLSWTQQELADRIESSQSYISLLENGDVDVQLAALPRPPDPEAITLAFEAVNALRDQADSIAPEDRGIVLRALGHVVVGTSRDAPIRVVPRPELRGFFPESDT